MRLSSCYVSLLAVALLCMCAPLAAQTASECGTGDSVAGYTTGEEFTIDFTDDVTIGELEVAVDASSTYMYYLQINVESPTGTTQRLFGNYRTYTANIDCVFSTYGVANTYPGSLGSYGTQGIFDCGGCRVRPAGTGATSTDSDMSAFTGESTSGDWILSVTTLSAYPVTVHQWCVLSYDTPGVTGLTATLESDEGPGLFSMAWTNSADVDYTELEIWSNDLLVATVDGADESWDNFGTSGDDSDDEPFPVPQLAELVVIAFSYDGDPGSPPAQVNLDLTPPVVASLGYEDATGTAIGGTSPEFLQVFSWEEDITIGASTVEMDLDYGYLYYLDIVVASHTGTTVSLFNNSYGYPATSITLTYSDAGRAFAASQSTCECLMQPQGPGDLADFSGEDTIDDDGNAAWAFAVIAGSPYYTGTVRTFRVDLYDAAGAPVEPVQDLTCYTDGLDLGYAGCTWTNGEAYTETRVWANGELVLEDTEEATAGESSGFELEDPVSSLPSVVTLTVRGYNADGAPSLKRSCSAQLEVPPLTGLSCSAGDEEGTVDMAWTNGYAYDSFELYIDGELQDSADSPSSGDELFTIEGPLDVPGAYVIELRGYLDGFDAYTSFATCRLMLLESMPVNECVFPGTTGSGYTDIEVFDVLTVKEAELAVDIRANIYNYYTTVTLASPSGVEIYVKPPYLGTTTAANIFCVFDDDGGSPGSSTTANFDCGCAIDPTAGTPGSTSGSARPMSTFEDEVSDGVWQVGTSTFSTYYNSTVNSLCLRLDGCDFLAPQDLTCEPDGDDAIALFWDNGDNEYTEINLFRNGELLASLDATDEEYSDTGLEPGRYSYSLEGTDGDCSAFSADCNSGVGFSEYCADSTITVSRVNEFSVSVDDAVQVGRVEVPFDHGHGYSPYLVTIVSPAGTAIDVFGAGYSTYTYLGAGGHMSMILSDDGEDATGIPDCGGCLISPNEPLDGFEYEIADGDWTLRIDTPTYYLFDHLEWCVSIYEGCEAVPPSDLECEADGNDMVLSWTNNETYTDILVMRDGEEVASIDGGEESYTDESLLAGFYTYRLLGVTDDCTTGSRNCDGVLGVTVLCSEDTPIDIDGASYETGESTVTMDVDIAVDEIQVLVDYSIAYAPYAVVTLDSPGGTSIYLRNGFSPSPSYSPNVHCLFADDGASQGSATLDCNGGCAFTPSDASVSLNDMTEDSPEGDWTLSASSYYGGSAFYNSTLNEWCLHIYEGCSLDRPANLTADYGKNAFTAVLEWEIEDGAEYDAILVNRNGTQIAELDGDATTYTDDDGRSGVQTYVIVGFDDELGCGRPSFSASISLGVTWFCPVDPDDDEQELVLGTFYQISLDYFDIQDEELEGCSDEIDEDAGDDPDMIRINDLHVRLAGDATGGYSMYHFSHLFSPSGTSVRLSYSGWTGGYSYFGGSDFDVVYSDDGASAYYTRSGFQRPFGPGTLSDFEGEDARGEWTFASFQISSYGTYFTGLCLGVFADACLDEGILFKRGDANNNGSVSALPDAGYLLAWGFSGGPAPVCRAQADCDGGGSVSVLVDASYLLSWAFGGGTAPPQPGPTTCGEAAETYTLDDDCVQDDINCG